MSSEISKDNLETQLKQNRIRIELEICKRSVIDFITDYCMIYEPRNALEGKPAKIKFDLRPRQIELVNWVLKRESTKTHGIIEKSRDEGMSYVMCAIIVHHWLFIDGFTAMLGSSKRDYVDKLGDPKSLFFKVRYILDNLPKWMLPRGYNKDKHDNFARIIHPTGDATIIGEFGNNMGRSGRFSMVLLDEFAFHPQADEVNRAVSQVSEVIIKGSTPQGVGNVFYTERFSGKFPVFTMHWKQNPDKDQAWYDKQVAQLDLITLAQEVNIDYTASVPNILIPNAWVLAATEIILEPGSLIASGVDVAADGKDYTCYTSRAGGVVIRCEKVEGKEYDRPAEIEEFMLLDRSSNLIYDQQGVGSGVTTTLKKKEVDGELSFAVTGVMNNLSCTQRIFDDQPEVPVDERFGNWVAEQWWSLRLRFQNSYNKLNGLANPQMMSVFL